MRGTARWTRAPRTRPTSSDSGTFTRRWRGSRRRRVVSASSLPARDARGPHEQPGDDLTARGDRDGRRRPKMRFRRGPAFSCRRHVQLGALRLALARAKPRACTCSSIRSSSSSPSGGPRSLLVVLFSRRKTPRASAARRDGENGVLRRLAWSRGRTARTAQLGFHVIRRVYVDPELERLLLGQASSPYAVVRSWPR